MAEPGADGSGRWPAKQQMPFAYRPGEARIAVPMASPKGITFRGLKSCVASFRVADVALCDIPTCFMTCMKSFYVAGAILRCVPSFHVASVAVTGQARCFITCQKSFYAGCQLPVTNPCESNAGSIS